MSNDASPLIIDDFKKSQWIQMFSGACFYPLDPDKCSIDINDIAHALSQLCRFAGHCSPFYSVAEHSVRVSRLFDDPELAFIGLMHDATEAYTIDLPSPLKKIIPQFYELEKKVAEIVGPAFNIDLVNMPREVKDADRILLITEARDLMTRPPSDWTVGDCKPLQEKIHPWSMQDAKQAFLSRFYELKYLRGQVQ